MSAGYRYRSQTCVERTEEAQANLLAGAIHRLWERWCGLDTDDEAERRNSVMGKDERFDDLMRHAYQQLKEMDVFYAGKHSGERQNP